MRQRDKIFITIFGHHVRLDRAERGYYLGDISIAADNTVFFHVEAIQLNKSGNALNPDYQNRIDRWVEANEDLDFHRIIIKTARTETEYFLNMEVYAR